MPASRSRSTFGDKRLALAVNSSAAAARLSSI